jgi:hypothetical protein
VPTLLIIDGFRFFFFSNESNEPPHIHIEKADDSGKFWLNPINLAYSDGFSRPLLKRVHQLLKENRFFSWRNGMNISIDKEPKASQLKFSEDSLIVDLTDGRTITVPLEWFPKLRDASDKDKNSWRFIGQGLGIHWDKLDEDLSVKGLLQPEFTFQRKSA